MFLLSKESQNVHSDKKQKEMVLEHINMHRKCLKLMQGE